MDGPPIDDGAVAVAGDRIAAVGRFEEIRALGGSVIDLGEVIILPGLINAHCHLDFTSLRGGIRPRRSFADWILQINRLRRDLSDEDFLVSIALGFAEARRWGTTTIANIESMPALLERMGPPPLRTWWFAELIDVRSRSSAKEMIEDSLSFLQNKENWLGGVGLSPHAPYTASPRLTRLAAETANRHKMLLTTHLAESNEEMEMFRHGRGRLFELLESLGRPMDDCGAGKTPLAVMLEREAINDRWIVVHLNELAGRRSRPPRKRTALSHRPLPAQQPIFSAPAFCDARVARPALQHLSWDRQPREQFFAQPFRRNANCAGCAPMAGAGADSGNGYVEQCPRSGSKRRPRENSCWLSGGSDRATDRKWAQRHFRKDYRVERAGAVDARRGRSDAARIIEIILIFAFSFLIREIVSALRIWPRSSS